jgi:hypothetical protein
MDPSFFLTMKWSSQMNQLRLRGMDYFPMLYETGLKFGFSHFFDVSITLPPHFPVSERQTPVANLNYGHFVDNPVQ